MALTQQFGAVAHQIVALDLLLADVEQGNTGGCNAFYLFGHDGAHHRKLQQGIGIATDVGAEIQHHSAFTTQCWQRLDEGWSVYPG